MRGMTVFVAVGVTLLLLEIWPDPAARAEDQVMCTKAGECTNIATREGQRRRVTIHRRASPLESRPTATDVDQTVRETIQKFSAALAVYDRQLSSYNRCIQTFDPSLNKAGCGNAPTPPNAPVVPSDTFSGRGNQPIPITAGQAAAIAVARLQLPKIPPGIGPSPDINPWKMAAVGYPLWLWADGPTHVSVRSTHEDRQGQSRHLRQDFV
jgi:hypothetical protein